VPGGPSLYASLACKALGANVTLVSTVEDAFERSALAGVETRFVEGELPRYANSYDAAGNRTQLLLAEGSELALLPLLPRGYTPNLVMLAPAFHEFRKAPLRFKGSLVGVSLQGALRSVDPEQRVVPNADPRGVATRFVRAGWVAFFSEEDTPEPESLARHIASLRGVAILTRGYNGATLFDSDGTEEHWAAIRADPIDPTGAGDCFASAFMVRLEETDDLRSAMRFALAAGALAVEGNGLAGIAGRAAIEARMTREAA